MNFQNKSMLFLTAKLFNASGTSQNKINYDLHSLFNIFSVHNLKLNSAKSAAMTFGPKKCFYDLRNTIKINILQNVLP